MCLFTFGATKVIDIDYAYSRVDQSVVTSLQNIEVGLRFFLRGADVIMLHLPSKFQAYGNFCTLQKVFVGEMITTTIFVLKSAPN